MLGNLFDVSNSSSKDGQSLKSGVSKQVRTICIRPKSNLCIKLAKSCHLTLPIAEIIDSHGKAIRIAVRWFGQSGSNMLSEFAYTGYVLDSRVALWLIQC
jgi:hypothetical protein